MLTTSTDPQIYVLDKALNYGNSGGPIVAEELVRLMLFVLDFSQWRYRRGTLRILRRPGRS
jgi:hypothetical protein